MREISQTIKTRTGLIGLERWKYWGHRPREIEDPDGAVLPKEFMESMLLAEDAPKIGERYFNAMLALYCDLMLKESYLKHLKSKRKVDSGLEVAVGFFYDDAHPKRGIFILVPEQEITKGSVDINWDGKLVDLITGEVYDGIASLPKTVHKLGTGHSHNDLPSYFSSTDDKHELPQPGLHIVCGEFELKGEQWRYVPSVSIVLGGVRYEKVLEGSEPRDMKTEDVTFEEKLCPFDFNKDVYDVIEIESPARLVPTFDGSFGAMDYDLALTMDGYGLDDKTCPNCYYGALEDGICQYCLYDHEEDAKDYATLRKNARRNLGREHDEYEKRNQLVSAIIKVTPLHAIEMSRSEVNWCLGDVGRVFSKFSKDSGNRHLIQALDHLASAFGLKVEINETEETEAKKETK